MQTIIFAGMYRGQLKTMPDHYLWERAGTPSPCAGNHGHGPFPQQQCARFHASKKIPTQRGVRVGQGAGDAAGREWGTQVAGCQPPPRAL